MAWKDDIDRHKAQLRSHIRLDTNQSKPDATKEEIPFSRTPVKKPRKLRHPLVTITSAGGSVSPRSLRWDPELKVGAARIIGRKHISPSDKTLPSSCFWISRTAPEEKVTLVAIQRIEIDGKELPPWETMVLRPSHLYLGRAFSRDRTRTHEFKIKVELPRGGSS